MFQLFCLIQLFILFNEIEPFNQLIEFNRSYDKICPRYESNVQQTGGKRITALILARGGSKGVRLKNLQMIGNHSLLGITIIQCYRSGIFDSVWVSTDNALIATEALSYGAQIHNRPSYLAADNTPSINPVQEFLSIHLNITNVGLIQCTSPFIKVHYLRDAFEKFQLTDCTFAVTRTYKLRWEENLFTGYAIPINFSIDRRPRRQDWSGELIETGMFYFSSRKLIGSGHFQSNSCSTVLIAPEDSLEIDSMYDLELTRAIVNRKLNSVLQP